MKCTCCTADNPTHYVIGWFGGSKLVLCEDCHSRVKDLYSGNGMLSALPAEEIADIEEYYTAIQNMPKPKILSFLEDKVRTGELGIIDIPTKGEQHGISR